jgi:hypothetical protein
MKGLKSFFASNLRKRFSNPSAKRIELTFPSPVNSISVEKARLRYNKKWAFSISLDDGYADAYTNVFNMFYGKYPDLNNVIHNGYFFTDGCGNDVMYKSGFAGPLVNSDGTDFHTETQNAYVKWSEYEFATDFGWDMIYQQYGQPAIENLITYNDFYQDTINGRNYVFEKLGFKPIFGTSNNGNSGWINNEGKCPLFDAGCRVISWRSTSAIVAGQLVTIEQSFNLDTLTKSKLDAGIVVRRELLSEDTIVLQDVYNAIADVANSPNHRWLHFFTHRVTYNNPPGSANLSVATFQAIMDHLHNNYGKGGLDNMWMAAPQEVYEYLYSYHTSTVDVYYEVNKVIIVVDFPNAPYDFRRFMLTLKVQLPMLPTQIDVFNLPSVTTNLNTTTNGIINFDWSPSVVQVAEKFVNKAETTLSPRDKDYAQFMVNKITALDIKQPLQIRINNIQEPVTRVFGFDFGIAGYWYQGGNWIDISTNTSDFIKTGFKELNTGELFNYSLQIVTAFSSNTTTGNTPSTPDSGAFPDKVLKDAFVVSTGSQGVFKLTGLNNSKKYDFEFISNKSNVDTVTKFVIGTQEVLVNASDNFNNPGWIYNVSPTNGEIVVTVLSFVAGGYINGMRLYEHN